MNKALHTHTHTAVFAYTLGVKAVWVILYKNFDS